MYVPCFPILCVPYLWEFVLGNLSMCTVRTPSVQDFKILKETTVLCFSEIIHFILKCIMTILEKKQSLKRKIIGSPQGGSNSRPLVYKTSALTTELWRLCRRKT